MNIKKKNGFTFIEILVVITIIGVVTSLGATSYGSFLKQSRDVKRKGDLEQIRAAIEMYKSRNNVYPTGAGVPPTTICDPAPNCASFTYLSKTPSDPMPTQYKYYYLSDGTTYTLGAHLELLQTGGTCGDCYISPPTLCNYCMGPYGQL